MSKIGEKPLSQSRIVENKQLQEVPEIHPIVLYELVYRLKKNGKVSWQDLLEITS